MSPAGSSGTTTTYYVRDAQGNVLGVYSDKPGEGLSWQEQHLYGSSRLGMFTPRDYIVNGSVVNAPPTAADPLGKRTYELSNHLGNVHESILDKKIQVTEGGISYFVPEIASTTDYYPFGMLMPERHGYKVDGGWASGGDNVGGTTVPQTITASSRSAGNTPQEYKASQWIEFSDGFESTSSGDEFTAFIGDGSSLNDGTSYGSGGENNAYRYGFNGKENDNEVKGEGAQQDYGFRIYDPRLGKFLSVDPLNEEYPELTPFQFGCNNPVQNIDLDGLEGADYRGRITNVTPEQRLNSPVWSFFKDLSADLLNNLSPAGAIDDAVDTWRNSNSSTLEKIQAGINVLTAPSFFPAKGPNERFNEERVNSKGSLKNLNKPFIEKTTEAQPNAYNNKQATQINQKNTSAATANSAVTINTNESQAVDRRGKIKNGPEFGDLKIHAKKHSEYGGGYATDYYNSAVQHTTNAKWSMKVTHNNSTKRVFITPTGNNTYMFTTSTNLSGTRIFTHMEVNLNETPNYFKNSGISLPKR